MLRFGCLMLVVALGACGGDASAGDSASAENDGAQDGSRGDADDGLNTDGEQGSPSRNDQSLAVATLNDLPPCNGDGALAYVASERNLYSCLDGEWSKADISAAGVVGPRGPAGGSGPQCKWCASGETTALHDGTQYRIFDCVGADADGCGTWSRTTTCSAQESIRSVPQEKDGNGIAARYPAAEFECYNPAIQQPTDDCLVDSDCPDARWQCAYGTPRRCVAKSSWMTGSGTWDYNADHFAWNVGSSQVSATCTWATSTYWFENAGKCTITLRGEFDAPEGGLESVYYSFEVTAATEATTLMSNQGRLSTNTTAPAHVGSVTETLDQVQLMTLDLRPGRTLSGTWKLEGTVSGANRLKASGQFMVTLPIE